MNDEPLKLVEELRDIHRETQELYNRISELRSRNTLLLQKLWMLLDHEKKTRERP